MDDFTDSNTYEVGFDCTVSTDRVPNVIRKTWNFIFGGSFIILS